MSTSELNLERLQTNEPELYCCASQEGVPMKTMVLPPSASSLMESIRSIGYSLEAAVADIVDNCIAADASNIDIRFLPINTPYIAIADDGYGMSSQELQAAMQYGSKNPLCMRAENDLGRYGLGLKTASLSQCQVLTVVSKKDNHVSCCRWNLHHIRKVNDWELLILGEDEISKLPCLDSLKDRSQGTLVIWQDLDRIFSSGDFQRDVLGAKMIKVREHLSLVFHRYLSGEPDLHKIQMTINSDKIFPIDPFLQRKSTKAMADESLFIRDQKVTVRAYILPHISKLSKQDLDILGGKEGLRKSQGFYVYRKSRLVVWGTWFRMMVKGDLSKLARIQVDIPNSLDELWTLDIKKSTAIPPEEVQKNLRKIVKKIAEQSKLTWTFRGKKERKSEKNEIWNRIKTRDGGFLYQINRDHFLLKEIEQKAPEISLALETMFKLIEDRLPLNSLYVDLVQDEKIVNNDEVLPAEILKQLKNILSIFPSATEKNAVIACILDQPPFCNHQDYIRQHQKELCEYVD